MMHGLLSLSGRAQRRGWVLGVQPLRRLSRGGEERLPPLTERWQGIPVRRRPYSAPTRSEGSGWRKGVRAALRVDGVNSLDEANHPASAP